MSTSYWPCQGTCLSHLVAPLSQGSPQPLGTLWRISNAHFSFKITSNNLRIWKHILLHKQNILSTHWSIDDTFGWCETGFQTKTQTHSKHLRGLRHSSGRENVTCLHTFFSYMVLETLPETPFGFGAAQSSFSSFALPLLCFLVLLVSLDHRASHST